MTTCREVHDFLLAWLDGELDAEVSADFEKHVAACPCCKNYMDSYRRTVELGRQAFDPCEPSEAEHPPLPDELVQAVLAARRKRSS